MPLQKLPVTDLDNNNHRRRARETINKILDHSFDDSRVRTAAEVAAGVTPVNYAYQPGDLHRQVTNTTPGTTDTYTGFQAAIDSASALHPVVRFSERAGISDPLLIRTTTTQAISIVGEGKAAARIEPLAADIKVAAQNINCCIFNQNNNPHLRLENLEFFSVAAYTGIGVYCVEGGGADGSGQALFSPVIRDIFFNFPTTNSGFLTGALQNGHVVDNTFEGSKGVFQIVGVGHSDVHYTNTSMYNCYDHFILQTADTNGAFLIHIEGLNAYVHNRGRLIDVQNWNGFNISNVVLEPAASNLGSVGIGKFKDCLNGVVTNFTSLARTNVPEADMVFEVDTSAIKFAHGTINADIGVRISGTGRVDLEFNDVDFTGSLTAAVQINANASGVIRFRGCKFNNSELSGFLTSAANSIELHFDDCTSLNAGLDAASGARNFIFNTSSNVYMNRCTFGQNDGDADAAFYIENAGSGTVYITDPIIVGTPPTGITTGSNIVFRYSVTAGPKTFQLDTGTSTETVNDTDVTDDCHITITPTNAAASTVQGSAQHLRVSDRTAGTSFTVTTGDGTTAAGNSTFTYRIIR